MGLSRRLLDDSRTAFPLIEMSHYTNCVWLVITYNGRTIMVGI